MPCAAKAAGALLETVECLADIELLALREPPQFRQRRDGRAVDREERRERGRGARPDALRQRGLFEKALGDLIGRSSADRAEPVRGEVLLDRRLHLRRAGAVEFRTRAGRPRLAVRSGDEALQPRRVAEAARQPPLPRRTEVELIQQRGEKRRVADGHPRPLDTKQRGHRERQPEYVGVGGDAVGAAKRLDARLPRLAAFAGPHAEHRPEVGVIRPPLGWPGRDVLETDGNRVVGPQRQFGAILGAGQVKPPPQILTGELDEYARGIHHRRLDEAIAGVGKKPAKGFVRVGHAPPRLPRGWALASSPIGRGPCAL